MQFPRAVVLLLPLLMAACSASETPAPLTTRVLDELPRVSNSPLAPCWQQKQIAAQNGFIDAIKLQRDVVYRAPCAVDKPAPAPVPAKVS